MLKNYFKLAIKVLLRRKFFTFISLFGISLTLLVLMVATALLDNLFAPRSPETRLERTLCVFVIGAYNGKDGGITSPPGYKFLDKYVRTLPDVERTAIFSQPSQSAVYKDGDRIDRYLKRVDGAYWQVLDFHFLEGRAFSAGDDETGARVAVINEATRTKLFGGASALGRTVTVASQTFRIVGVVGNIPFTRFAPFSDIWVPLGSATSSAFRDSMFGDLNGLVVAKSKADFPRLQREYQRRLRTVPASDVQGYTQMRGGLDTYFDSFARTLGNDSNVPALVKSILVLAALLFMALPTVNLVSINLSRIMERASEIGVRKAFGASSQTLVGQFVVENLVLTVIGGIVGFILSAVVIATLNGLEVIPYAHFDLNLRIFIYGMLIAMFFGVFSGVYPAWKMSRLNPVNALRGGSL